MLYERHGLVVSKKQICYEDMCHAVDQIEWVRLEKADLEYKIGQVILGIDLFLGLFGFMLFPDLLFICVMLFPFAYGAMKVSEKAEHYHKLTIRMHDGSVAKHRKVRIVWVSSVTDALDCLSVEWKTYPYVDYFRSSETL